MGSSGDGVDDATSQPEGFETLGWATPFWLGRPGHSQFLVATGRGEGKKTGSCGSGNGSPGSRDGLVPGSRNLPPHPPPRCPATGSAEERGRVLLCPASFTLPFSQQEGCLPSNPGLYSMHNHCSGHPRPG